jgi:hypothetical protein
MGEVGLLMKVVYAEKEKEEKESWKMLSRQSLG